MGKHHHHHDHHHLQSNEKLTAIAIFLSIGAMGLELFYGYKINSVALIMDGWHMLTHVLVLGLAWLTYKLIDLGVFSGIHEHKVLSASGFISAFILLSVTLWMLIESFTKFMKPDIDVTMGALLTSVIGLVVNGVSAFILHKGHEHDHADINLHAAYLHVLSDVVLSIFAIIALISARYFNIDWMDAVCGIVASLIILKWSAALLKKSYTDFRAC
jgi:cation diffusion facilitator family transporter